MNEEKTVGINYLLDRLEIQGDRKTDRLVYLNALLFHASIVLNATSGSVKKYNGKNVTFYGLTLANSAAGKDFSFELASQVMHTNSESFKKAYISLMKSNLFKNIEHNEEYDDEMKERLTSYVPQNVIVSASGTKEGVYSLANSIALSQFGSLNITSSEIGDEVSNSNDLLNMLKQLYDGNVNAKVIKGESVINIDNIVTNVLLFGSNVGFDLESKKKLVKLLSSGMLRRSLVVEIPTQKIVRNSISVNERKEMLLEAKEYGKQIVEMFGLETQLEKDYLFSVTEQYLDFLEKMKDEIIEDINSSLENSYKMVDIGSIELIENLAHLIAFLDMTNNVDEIHLKEAYNLFRESRNTIKDTLSPVRTEVSMFNMLKLSNKKMSFVDIANYIEIPSNKQKRAELIELFKEYVLHKGYVPVVTGNEAKYFSIKEPERNKLDKIIVSIDAHDYEYTKKEPRESISFAQLELPFFGSTQSIEGLVRSTEVKSFTTCHYESSAMSIKYGKIDGVGHRKEDNFISGQNLIAFDVDNDISLYEAIEKLKDYTYLIYTTKSHRKEKEGVLQGDRFRILIPTKTKFFVDAEKHKLLYENIADFLGIKNYDKATRNVSRLWFTNPEAEIYKNEANLLDVQALIPETEKAEHVLPLINKLEEDFLSDEVDEATRRLNGMKRWFLSQTGVGERNSNLYRYGKFIKDIGFDVDNELTQINSMLMEPLEERELRTVINSVLSK